MRIPKRYGEYKVERCPFCNRQATAQNSEGVPVCYEHKSSKLPELKCLCGSYLEMRKGKFGVFFSCVKCGNINKSKAFEVNDIASAKAAATGAGKRASDERKADDKKPMAPREITVRADDPYYCR